MSVQLGREYVPAGVTVDTDGEVLILEPPRYPGPVVVVRPLADGAVQAGLRRIYTNNSDLKDDGTPYQVSGSVFSFNLSSFSVVEFASSFNYALNHQYYGATEITVDWGDGTVDVFTPPYATSFSHTYTKTGLITIVITAVVDQSQRWPGMTAAGNPSYKFSITR